MAAGEIKTWETLEGLSPEAVCARTDAGYDESKELYQLSSFGRDFLVSPAGRQITGDFPGSDLFLQKIGYFFRLSVVGYLALARDVVPGGRLVNPVSMKSGQLFFRGSHVLPLDRISARFGADREGFLRQGLELGGRQVNYGDVSVEVLPLPRVPVTIILWLEDEEFPARTDLLFDSACEVQLPVDVIWSIAMLTVMIFLQDPLPPPLAR